MTEPVQAELCVGGRAECVGGAGEVSDEAVDVGPAVTYVRHERGLRDRVHTARFEGDDVDESRDQRRKLIQDVAEVQSRQTGRTLAPEHLQSSR